MMAKHCAVWVMLWVLYLCPATSFAQDSEGGWQPGLYDISAMALLAGAQGALENLEAEQSPMQRQIYLTTALSSLSALYQLHGAKWALEGLMPLYSEPDCPDIHFGYSVDGRIRLSVEPLALQNPAFDDYTVLLITLESNSGGQINADNCGMLEVQLLDGSIVVPEQLTLEHVLWERLKRLADTFEPPQYIHPGGSTAFKQIYSVKGLADKAILTVSLVWDGYTIYVPYYEHQVDQQ